MDRAALSARVHALYQNRLTNDLEQCLDSFLPNATFDFSGSQSIHASGATPPANLRELMTGIIARWHWHSINIYSLLIDGNKAAVHYQVNVTYIPNNTRVETDLFDLMEFKDGKVYSFLEFVDTEMVAKLMAVTSEQSA